MRIGLCIAIHAFVAFALAGCSNSGAEAKSRTPKANTESLGEVVSSSGTLVARVRNKHMIDLTIVHDGVISQSFPFGGKRDADMLLERLSSARVPPGTSELTVLSTMNAGWPEIRIVGLEEGGDSKLFLQIVRRDQGDPAPTRVGAFSVTTENRAALIALIHMVRDKLPEKFGEGFDPTQ